jgi:hypothetical protein
MRPYSWQARNKNFSTHLQHKMTGKRVLQMSSTASARHMKKKTKTESTRRNYGSKVNRIIALMSQKHPQQVDINSNKIFVPLPKEIVLEFFCSLMFDASTLDLTGELDESSSVPKSVSHIERLLKRGGPRI